MAKKYFITVRTNVEGTEYTFKEVDGSKLNKEYFAYKRDVIPKDWIITDLESGVSIKTGLATLKACKEYLAGLSEEDLAMISKILDESSKEENKHTR